MPSSQPSAESAASILIRSAQQSRDRLVDRVSGGSRDWPQMRADLEQFIESLAAADHLRKTFEQPAHDAQS